MRKSIFPLLICLSLVFLPSCKEEKKPGPKIWRTYSEEHRQIAHLNDLAYWNDLFRECFPVKVEGKILDRIDLNNMNDSLPVTYYTDMGAKFWTKENVVPSEFAGYYVKANYNDPEKKYPLEIVMFFSRAGVRKWRKDVSSGAEMKKKTIGEFTVYEGKLNLGASQNIWGFYDEYLCVMHPIGDKAYKVLNCDLFYEVIGELDPECIKAQLPDF